jgi:hypothetical protein
VVVAIGLTVILVPVMSFDHLIVPPSHPVALSLTLPPSHITAFSAEIDGAVHLFTITVTGAEASLIHLPFLQTAVYDVFSVGETTMLAPVMLLLQIISPSQPVAVNVEDPPRFIVDGAAVTVGAEIGVTVIV